MGERLVRPTFLLLPPFLLFGIEHPPEVPRLVSEERGSQVHLVVESLPLLWGPHQQRPNLRLLLHKESVAPTKALYHVLHSLVNVPLLVHLSAPFRLSLPSLPIRDFKRPASSVPITISP